MITYDVQVPLIKSSKEKQKRIWTSSKNLLNYRFYACKINFPPVYQT